MRKESIPKPGIESRSGSTHRCVLIDISDLAMCGIGAREERPSIEEGVPLLADFLEVSDCSEL